MVAAVVSFLTVGAGFTYSPADKFFLHLQVNIFMCDLVCNDGYVNLWEFGAKNRLAQIVDYSGEKILAEQDKEYRTYSGNTHIDYFLAKNDAFALNSIMIDNRTLAFTDHCGIFVDLNMK